MTYFPSLIVPYLLTDDLRFHGLNCCGVFSSMLQKLLLLAQDILPSSRTKKVSNNAEDATVFTIAVKTVPKSSLWTLCGRPPQTTQPTTKCRAKNALTDKETTPPSTEDAQISQGESRIYQHPCKKPRIKISLDENLTNHQIMSEDEKHTYVNVIRNQNEQNSSPNHCSKHTPPNPTEVDLFSTTLKLVHLEEIYGPLLLIAYRAALPAIRKTNCMDEKILYLPGEVWSFPI
ncbi:hypothetical protein CEXT_767591 [Caerostris extrusa]|uniref:Uncharacterized protein n=1 Tax=Caerostris extrusa TaxID=172846 RepID=A0AAV4WNJ4_CAEEX|nr:hypothetical protein CEXT_767591 [Caerostris extrusa]